VDEKKLNDRRLPGSEGSKLRQPHAPDPLGLAWAHLDDAWGGAKRRDHSPHLGGNSTRGVHPVPDDHGPRQKAA